MEQPANQGRTPVREWILDMRGQAQDGDARNVINGRRRGDAEARAAAGYHPRWGGRYDSQEDRSPTPETSGTRVFSREIRTASFPQCFWQPTTIDKYTGETDPSCVAQRLPPVLPAGRIHHRCGDHPQSAAAPRGLGPNVARALAAQPNPQLGRLGLHIRRKLPGHIRAPW
jgi:hypothetical protein